MTKTSMILFTLLFASSALAQKSPPTPQDDEQPWNSATKIEFSFDKDVVNVQAGALYVTILKVKDFDTFKVFHNDGTTSLKTYPSTYHSAGYLNTEIQGGATEPNGWAIAGYAGGEYTFVHTKRAISMVGDQPITTTIVRRDRYRITDPNPIAVLRDLNTELGSSGAFFADQTILISPKGN